MAKRRRLSPALPTQGDPATSQTNTLRGGAVAMTGAPPPIAQVAHDSAGAAALRDMAQGLEAARAEGRMVVDIPLADVAPGHLIRDRITLDRDEMEALKQSIAAHGQRVPAEVVPLTWGSDIPDKPTAADGGADIGPSTHAFGLISGWRRLTVLNELHAETGDPRFSTLRALIKPQRAAAQSYVAMVEENELRVGLSYYERARLVAEATKAGIFEDQATALRELFAGASRAKRSKILSFVTLHEMLGDCLYFPTSIPERLGLALVAELKSNGSTALKTALEGKRSVTANEELVTLERALRGITPAVSHAKHNGDVICEGVVMRAKHRGTKLIVELSGDAVDQDFVERVKAMLRRL